MKKDDFMIWHNATICTWLAGFFAIVLVIGFFVDVAPSEHRQRDALCYYLTFGILTALFLVLAFRAKRSAKTKGIL
jgi:hypothetical protein